MDVKQQHNNNNGSRSRSQLKVMSLTPILRIGDQVLAFDVFWPKHLQEVRSTVYIHVQSMQQM